jgi:hypothetical protein
MMPPFLLIFETSITFIQYVHPSPFAEVPLWTLLVLLYNGSLLEEKPAKSQVFKLPDTTEHHHSAMCYV